MAFPANNVNNPAPLLAENPENQQASLTTEHSTYSPPEGAPPRQGEDSDPPLPHERKLSENARLAIEKRAEAKRAKAEAKYYARKERIEHMFTSNPDHPKALRRRNKLHKRHVRKLSKIEEKYKKEMAAKKDRFEHPEKYAFVAPGVIGSGGAGAACGDGGAC